MNSRPSDGYPAPRASRICFATRLGLAGLILVLCLSAFYWTTPADGKVGKRSRVPAGQLSADLRSLAAALRYLAEPVPPSLVQTASVVPQTGIAVEVGGYPDFSIISRSNQMEMLEPLTNRPART